MKNLRVRRRWLPVAWQIQLDHRGVLAVQRGDPVHSRRRQATNHRRAARQLRNLDMQQKSQEIRSLLIGKP